MTKKQADAEETSFQQASSQHADVIIIGAGLVGAALAIALGQGGLRVVLCDKANLPDQLSPNYDGRASAIALGSERVLTHLGVWPQVLAEAEPILDIRVSDDRSPFYLHYDHREVGAEPFGHIVENRVLRVALLNGVRATPNVTLRAPSTVQSIHRDAQRATVTLESGETWHAPLIIAADGRYSRLREEAGIPFQLLQYGQTAIVCTLAHSGSHHGWAVEHFMPPGPFAVLPMTRQRSCIVWTESDALAPEYAALPEAEFLAEIRKRLGDYLGEIRLDGPRFSYPLNLMLARRYSDQRLALVGDAAHAIHPIAGQGVNIGFRDVAVLAELLLDAARLGQDLGAPSILAHYERWRAFDATAMSLVTDALNRLFSNRSRLLRLARGVGMTLVGKMPAVKHFLMRDAMGLTGDLPRMMRQ